MLKNVIHVFRILSKKTCCSSHLGGGGYKQKATEHLDVELLSAQMTWQQLTGAEPPPRWMFTERVFSHRGSCSTPFFRALRLL